MFTLQIKSLLLANDIKESTLMKYIVPKVSHNSIPPYLFRTRAQGTLGDRQRGGGQIPTLKLYLNTCEIPPPPGGKKL